VGTSLRFERSGKAKAAAPKHSEGAPKSNFATSYDSASRFHLPLPFEIIAKVGLGLTGFSLFPKGRGTPARPDFAHFGSFS